MIARRGGAGSFEVAGMPGAAVQAAVFVLLVAFYLLTAPGNHTESMDGFSYTTKVVEEPLGAAPHRRILLWVAGMRCLYLAASAVVPSLDPYALISGVDAAFAALGVILLASLLRHGFRLDPRSSWLTAGVLAVSYGFWRYAAEVEIYAAAILVMLGLLRLLFHAEDRAGPDHWRAVVPTAIAAGLGILVYQPVGILAGIVLPLYLLARGRAAWLPAYGLIAGGIVSLGYVLSYQISGAAGSMGAVRFLVDLGDFKYEPFGAAMFMKMALAFGHDVVSTNWVYGIDALRGLAERAVPHWVHDEEIYAARHAGWLAFVPLLTLPAMLVALVAAAATAWRRPAAARLDRRGQAMLLWFLVHAAVMAYLSPAGREGWIPALVPFAILTGLLLVRPCAATGRWWPPVLLVLALFAHNAGGGIGMVLAEEGDHHRARSAWLVEHARVEDLVVVSVNEQHEDHLRYWLPAEVIRLDDVGVETAGQAIEATFARGGRVFVFDEFLNPPVALAARWPEMSAAAEALAAAYRGRARPMHVSDAGTTYQLGRTR